MLIFNENNTITRLIKSRSSSITYKCYNLPIRVFYPRDEKEANFPAAYLYFLLRRKGGKGLNIYIYNMAANVTFCGRSSAKEHPTEKWLKRISFSRARTRIRENRPVSSAIYMREEENHSPVITRGCNSRIYLKRRRSRHDDIVWKGERERERGSLQFSPRGVLV